MTELTLFFITMICVAIWMRRSFNNQGSPLPDLPVEKPETYEAGFNLMEGEPHSLNLPDDSSIWYIEGRWSKGEQYDPQPHTLTRVNQHTVGRFYLTEGEDPDDYESYALCVAEGKFVQATMSNGVVEVLVVDELFPNQVSLQEVTPAT